MRPASALVVVDMQTGLDDPQYGQRSNPQCEENIALLIDAWRRASLPILYTRHLSLRPNSPLCSASPGVHIKACVWPADGEPVFDKSTNSVFKNISFGQALEARGTSELVFVGMTTDACVTASAREAKDLGYSVSVIGDACATFARPGPDGTLHAADAVHNVSLAALGASGISISVTAYAIQCLCRLGGRGDASPKHGRNTGMAS
ncbi:MAG: cysteine hydrolase family protein [Rhodoferax sp.]|nr:cysteine hydrolase family protein [Rhodoferax sp.]